jgi:hypothetical protein
LAAINDLRNDEQLHHILTAFFSKSNIRAGKARLFRVTKTRDCASPFQAPFRAEIGARPRRQKETVSLPKFFRILSVNRSSGTLFGLFSKVPRRLQKGRCSAVFNEIGVLHLQARPPQQFSASSELPIGFSPGGTTSWT